MPEWGQEMKISPTPPPGTKKDHPLMARVRHNRDIDRLKYAEKGGDYGNYEEIHRTLSVEVEK